MLRICATVLCGLLLVACGAPATPAAPLPASDTAQSSATATPPFALVTTPTPDPDGVLRSPIDQMPIIMGRTDLAPRMIDGVLRSPLDNMPIIPGNPHTAPMPNTAGPP